MSKLVDAVEHVIERVEWFGSQTVGLAGRVAELLAHRLYREERLYALHDIVVDGDIRPHLAVAEAVGYLQNDRLIRKQPFLQVLVDLLAPLRSAILVHADLDSGDRLRFIFRHKFLDFLVYPW